MRMVAETCEQHESEWAAIGEVARLLGVGSSETVHKWVRQAEVDAGAHGWESAELKRLRRNNAELRRANAILKAASAFFAAEFDRQCTDHPVHRRSAGPPRGPGWSALGCRVDLHGAKRAGCADRPTDFL